MSDHAQLEIIRAISRYSIIAGFWTIVLWIVMYSIMSNWWDNPVGRNWVITKACLGGILGIISFWYFFPAWAHSLAGQWAVTVLLVALPVTMAWRMVVFYRLDRDQFWTRVYRLGYQLGIRMTDRYNRKLRRHKTLSPPADDSSSPVPESPVGPDPAPPRTAGQ